MFRIDRNYVQLGAMRSARVGSADAIINVEAGHYPESEANAEAIAKAKAKAEAEAITSQASVLAGDIVSDAKKKAKRILMDARNEVAALLLSTRDQVEEDRNRAWQEGFVDGSEEGRHSFDDQLVEKQRLDDESLKRVLDEIYDERTRMYNGLKDEVKTLALEIVRKVINPAEEELGSVFESLIRNALNQINPDKKVIIRVSPVEYERFFPSGNTVFILESGVKVTASILRDVSLEEGDCIIDTEDATVNAGFESQLKYIGLAFDQVTNRGVMNGTNH